MNTLLTICINFYNFRSRSRGAKCNREDEYNKDNKKPRDLSSDNEEQNPCAENHPSHKTDCGKQETKEPKKQKMSKESDEKVTNSGPENSDENIMKMVTKSHLEKSPSSDENKAEREPSPKLC